jgi:hypothetical protein
MITFWGSAVQEKRPSTETNTLPQSVIIATLKLSNIKLYYKRAIKLHNQYTTITQAKNLYEEKTPKFYFRTQFYDLPGSHEGMNEKSKII